MKKLGATENSFQAVALEWYEKSTIGKSDSHKKRTLRILNNDLFPWIGSKPITELRAPELLATLQRIESRSAIETTHRALQISRQIFRYAEASGKVERDVTQALRGALTKPTSSNFASLTEPD
jgi:integrase